MCRAPGVPVGEGKQPCLLKVIVGLSAAGPEPHKGHPAPPDASEHEKHLRNSAQARPRGSGLPALHTPKLVAVAARVQARCLAAAHSTRPPGCATRASGDVGTTQILIPGLPRAATVGGAGTAVDIRPWLSLVSGVTHRSRAR